MARRQRRMGSTSRYLPWNSNRADFCVSSPVTHTNPKVSCDLFCRVIDNFGDAGVCWRLARQLADHCGWSVRLVIDQITLIDRLHPDLQTRPKNVLVVEWSTLALTSQVPNVVIEAFGCYLPEPYLTLLRTTQQKFAWVNLEYLSAEGWIEGCHRLMSPDPVTGKPKYFFFPGFTSLSGGLIREPKIDVNLAAFRAADFRHRWLQSIGIETHENERMISLFAYPGSPLSQLFRQFSTDPQPVHCLLAGGMDEYDLQKNIDNAAAKDVRVSRLPFLPQDDYDRLLASCEINFVRGEDSFVRSQWIGNPFIWQAYRQQEETHHGKLSAFLDQYLLHCDVNVAEVVRCLHMSWNDALPWRDGIWEQFIANRAGVAEHNQKWGGRLALNGNLAENLAAFCESKL